MADINDRLDRLQRREEFDRFGRPLRHAQTPMRVAPLVDRPAGVDDRLGEVLDAVASVVCRHPGMSVMVALADGQAGRPVIRVTEREGGVDAGVVVVGTAPPRPVEPTTRPGPLVREAVPSDYGPYDGLSTTAAAPARESVPGSDPVFEPAFRDGSAARDSRREELTVRDEGPSSRAADEQAPARDGMSYGDVPFQEGEPGRERPASDGGGSFGGGLPSESVRGGLPSESSGRGVASQSFGEGLAGSSGGGVGSESFGEGVPSRNFGEGSREAAEREAAGATVFDGRHAAAREQQAGSGRSGSSWHDALWSPESRDRFRQAERERRAQEERPPAPASSIPLPEDTSQVVSRLAQLLRENPTLSATWSREAQE